VGSVSSVQAPAGVLLQLSRSKEFGLTGIELLSRGLGPRTDDHCGNGNCGRYAA
jgi:hypothetical protein